MEIANLWSLEQFTDRLDAMVAVPIKGREVWIRPWLYRLDCPLGHCVPVLLLDTDLDQNNADDRRITDRLYGGHDLFGCSVFELDRRRSPCSASHRRACKVRGVHHNSR
ncbi:MAG: hypothetical protein P8Y71_05585 [Pseudolabrys sp.]|jgi:glucan phosphorylase